MPYLPNEREYRSVALMNALSGSQDRHYNSDFYVEGYATTYNQPYELGKFDGIAYREQIDRHALDGADLSDVIMQLNHAGRVMARISNDTLFLNPDDQHGLFFAGDLSRSDLGHQIYSDIAAGLLTGCSWCFTVAEDEYDVATHTRTIKKIRKVYDVSVVSIPVNPATDVSARSFCERMAAEARQREAAELARRERLQVECLALLRI